MYNAKGIFRFYDGIIKGQKSISGNIDEVETNYEVIRTEEENIESAYLGKDISIAQINDIKYDTLDEAIKDCPEGMQTTIKIIRNANFNAETETYIINESQDIILNLNGYSLSSANNLILINYGKLKIIDSSEEQLGVIENTAGIVIDNEGELELNGGTIRTTKTGTETDYAKAIISKGKINQTGGNIEATGENSYGIYQDEIFENEEEYKEYTNAEIISNGEYSFKNVEGIIEPDMPNDKTTNKKDAYGYIEIDLKGKEGIYDLRVKEEMTNESNYTVLYGTISEDTIATSDKAFMQTTNKRDSYEAQLEGGKTYYLHLRYYRYSYESAGETKITAIELKKNTNKVVTTIEEGKITAYSVGIYNKSGNVKTIKGIINATAKGSYGINNIGIGTIEMEGGNVVAQTAGIYNTNTGIIRITGGEILANASGGSSYGIYNSIGRIEIEEGKISAAAPDTWYGGYSYGIFNNAGDVEILKGTVTGIEGDAVYGIYNNTGKVKIFEGVVTTEQSYACIGINNASGTIEIERGEVTGKQGVGINNASGTIIMRGGKIERPLRNRKYRSRKNRDKRRRNKNNREWNK